MRKVFSAICDALRRRKRKATLSPWATRTLAQHLTGEHDALRTEGRGCNCHRHYQWMQAVLLYLIPACGRPLKGVT
jgi:hypothetical protein